MAGQGGILDEICARIDAGRLLPGDVLDEQGLTREFGVSRTPVREALLKLEALGLVRRRPRGGAVVFRPTLEEFLAILEVHAKLEGQAAGLAARRLNPASAARIEAAVAACEAHAAGTGANTDGTDEYYPRNLEFHLAVALAAHNGVLLDLIRANARKLLAYYRARYRIRGTVAQSAVEHRAIFTAIAAGESAEAEALMARHVQFDSVTAMDLLATLGPAEAA